MRRSGTWLAPVAVTIVVSLQAATQAGALGSCNFQDSSEAFPASGNFLVDSSASTHVFTDISGKSYAGKTCAAAFAEAAGSNDATLANCATDYTLRTICPVSCNATCIDGCVDNLAGAPYLATGTVYGVAAEPNKVPTCPQAAAIGWCARQDTSDNMRGFCPQSCETCPTAAWCLDAGHAASDTGFGKTCTELGAPDTDTYNFCGTAPFNNYYGTLGKTVPEVCPMTCGGVWASTPCPASAPAPPAPGPAVYQPGQDAVVDRDGNPISGCKCKDVWPDTIENGTAFTGTYYGQAEAFEFTGLSYFDKCKAGGTFVGLENLDPGFSSFLRYNDVDFPTFERPGLYTIQGCGMAKPCDGDGRRSPSWCMVDIENPACDAAVLAQATGTTLVTAKDSKISYAKAGCVPQDPLPAKLGTTETTATTVTATTRTVDYQPGQDETTTPGCKCKDSWPSPLEATVWMGTCKAGEAGKTDAPGAYTLQGCGMDPPCDGDPVGSWCMVDLDDPACNLGEDKIDTRNLESTGWQYCTPRSPLPPKLVTTTTTTAEYSPFNPTKNGCQCKSTWSPDFTRVLESGDTEPICPSQKSVVYEGCGMRGIYKSPYEGFSCDFPNVFEGKTGNLPLGYTTWCAVEPGCAGAALHDQQGDWCSLPPDGWTSTVTTATSTTLNYTTPFVPGFGASGGDPVVGANCLECLLPKLGTVTTTLAAGDSKCRNDGTLEVFENGEPVRKEICKDAVLAPDPGRLLGAFIADVLKDSECYESWNLILNGFNGVGNVYVPGLLERCSDPLYVTKLEEEPEISYLRVATPAGILICLCASFCCHACYLRSVHKKEKRAREKEAKEKRRKGGRIGI